MGRIVWQVVGSHPKHGKLARQIKATKEVEVFQSARELVRELDTGIKGRVVPTGQVQRAERAAITTTASKGHRDATTSAKVKAIRTVSSWLADNEQGVEDHSLQLAIRKLAPLNNRRRRSMVEGARALAQAANTPFSAEGLQYAEPQPRRRDAVSDEDIFRRLDKVLPKINNPGAVWVFRMVGILGIRGNGVLSLNIPDIFDKSWPHEGGFKPGVQLPYWDSKRNRAGFATPTIRDWFDHWNLWDRPEELTPYLMPHDHAANNEQVDKANRLLSTYSAYLRRRVHPDASESIGFRALRHAATARLLKSGMSNLLVADLTSTSLIQIEKTYSDYYRQHAVEEAARLL